MRRIFRVFLFILLILLLLLIGAVAALQLPSVQTEIVQKVMKQLNTEFGTQIQVERVDIDFWGDIHLYQVSAKDSKNLEFISIEEVVADLSLWDIVQNSSDIKVDNLTLNNANVQVITYKNEEQDNFLNFIDLFVSEDEDSTSNFKLKGNVSIRNSRLSIINQNLEKSEQVWLSSRNINADIYDFNLMGDTYQADVQKLSFLAEKNGEAYEVKNFKTRFRMTPQQMSFDELNINTQSSDLKGSLTFLFDDLEAFSDFNQQVKWDLNLNKNSELGFKDVRYFVPEWNRDEKVKLEGNVSGVLNDLYLKDFSLSTRNTYIKSARLNLSEIMNGSYQINSNRLAFSSSYTDLIAFLPDVYNQNIPQEIKRLGQVNYVGKLDLDEQNLYAKGKINSKIGGLDLNTHLFDYQSDSPTYQGKITAIDLDLGQLSGEKSLGRINGTFDLKGKNFDLENMDLLAIAWVKSIEIGNETYTNINIDGRLNQSIFDGLISSNDSRFKGEYQGKLDFGQPNLKFNFNSNIDFLDLNQLGILQTPNSWLKGEIQALFDFENINQLQGNIVMKDALLNIDTVQVNLPIIHLNIFEDEENEKNITLDIPHQISAKIKGKYNLDEIAHLLQNGIGNFLVEYVPEKVSQEQYISYNIDIEGDIVSKFVPGLYLQPQTKLIGYVNQDENMFELDLSSPYAQYENYKADSLRFYASTSLDSIFELHSKSIKYNDIKLKDFKIHGQRKKDTLLATSHFYIGDKTSRTIDLNFYQTFTQNRQLKMGFAPSTIKIDNQVWDINPNNETDSNYALINLKNKVLKLENFRIQSENQFIKINGKYLSEQNFDVDLKLENVFLEKVIPQSALGDFSLKGVANGSVQINKTEDEIEPIATLSIDLLKLNEHDIGNLTIDTKYDIDEQIFDLNGSLKKEELDKLILAGQIDNKGERPELDLVANFDDFEADLLSVFLAGVLENWSGLLSGDLHIKGDVLNPNLQGFVSAKDIGFNVVYLGTNYLMKGTNDLFLNKEPSTNGFIQLSDIEITETSSDTKANLEGALYFSSFSDWFLDLDFTTDRLMVMNTDIHDNELFYGKIYGQGEFGIFGPATDSEVAGFDVNILKGSEISLNTGSTKTAEENKFIQFYSTDTNGIEIAENSTLESEAGISINLLLNCDDQTTVNLVIDNKTDDQIEAHGNAENFTLQMNKAGNLNIEGDYTITKGTYNYRYNLIIDKEFELEKGGYIRFNGNPYNAELNISALYEKTVNNLGDYLGTSYSQPVETEAVIGMTGDLENMNIDFDVRTPRLSSQMQSMLDQKLDTSLDERIAQVGAILALGKFNTESQLSGNDASFAAVSTAFDLLGKQVGNLFSDIIPNLEINPVYLQSSDTENYSDVLQTQLQYSLNERLKINGAIGAPISSQYDQSYSTEIQLDYDISKQINGELILRAFSRPSTLGIENANTNTEFTQSYGAGIVFRKSFNSFGEFFGWKNRKKNKKDRKKIKAQQDSILQKQRSQLIEFDDTTNGQ